MRVKNNHLITQPSLYEILSLPSCHYSELCDMIILKYGLQLLNGNLLIIKIHVSPD
jgi:hypothetical protein